MAARINKNDSKKIKNDLIDHNHIVTFNSQHNEHQYLYRLPKEVLGYLMFNFLTPFEICKCLLTFCKIFHNNLSNSQMETIMKMRKFGVFDSVQKDDLEFTKHLFRVHNLDKWGSAGIKILRLDKFLPMCAEAKSFKCFDFLCDKYEMDIQESTIANALLEAAKTHIQEDKNLYITMKFMDVCKARGIDVKTLHGTTDQAPYTTAVLHEILEKAVKCNRLNLLQNLNDKYDIKVPMNMIYLTNNTNVINYIIAMNQRLI